MINWRKLGAGYDRRRLGFKETTKKLSTVRLQYPQMQTATRKQLYEVFLEDLYELEKILERDLSIWG